MNLCGIGPVVPSDRKYPGDKGQLWPLLESISYKLGILALDSAVLSTYQSPAILTGPS